MTTIKKRIKITKYKLWLIIFLGVSCSKFQAINPAQTCSAEVRGDQYYYTCSNGHRFYMPIPESGLNGLPGLNGINGQDGANGQDGQDAVIVDSKTVPANSCTKVADNLWVQNINFGDFFDVYYNDQCADHLGEYCDNVEPSEGATGDFGDNEPGSSEICLIGHDFVAGQRQSNGDIKVYIYDFTEGH